MGSARRFELFVVLMASLAAGTNALRHLSRCIDPRRRQCCHPIALLAASESAEACTKGEPTCYITIGGVRPFHNAISHPSPDSGEAICCVGFHRGLPAQL
jgi:hypothetical protein